MIWTIAVETMVFVSLWAVPVLLLWVPLLGLPLKKFLPKYHQAHYVMFLVSWICLIGMIIWSYQTPHLPRPGWVLIPVILAGFFVEITLFAFVARAIKSLQTKDRATVNDYFADIFLILFFIPIGVWFLQPRLNHLYDEYFRD